MELYLKLNPDQVKPYTITLIKRDSKAPSGAEAKVAVQELLTQDKVDALAGWVYSPDAIASAPLITAGKKLAVIMNAGTAFITNLAPDFVRTSFSMWHAGYALGVASAKTLHAKTAVVAYSDFPPGKDSLDAFKAGFEANGGKVIDAIPAGGPGAVPDFTPFFQRAKDEKPDVDGMEGRKSLEVITAIYESVESGREVRLPFTPKYSRLGKPVDGRR